MGELIRDLKRELREEILQGMSYERQMTDEELAQVIDGKILEQMEREPMALRDRLRLQKELFDSFRRLDILQELVDDPGITEIMVNGPEEVFVETEGRIRRWEKSFESREQLLELIRQIVSRVNRTVNTASPIVDARLETMVLMGMELPLPAIRSQIASALDVMVHVARMRDRSRKVTAIEEVVGIENGEIVLRPLFSLDREGELRKAGNLRRQEKLRRAGYGL